ncbi:auxin efflux carrier [Nitzschia inconspicua]|uniref:Auxin efflux carrier n=1 Tax=Nitzschia inconspicua TaxID=303405 RepID=A0A9K3Q4Y8_9STRA|nr:auxin efflux carrier [Nitzschia inconspicua]
MTWKYTNVLNECIMVLLTIGLGIVASRLEVIEFQSFVPSATKFVFYIALPCLVIQGLGIGMDFYSDTLLWNFFGAYLVLRAIFLVVSLILVGLDRSKGIGYVAVYWLSFTWISTVILGVPISAAVFGNANVGKKFGILAGVSSFIFQLPLQLFFLECHALQDSSIKELKEKNRVHECEEDIEGCGADESEEINIQCERDGEKPTEQVLPRKPSSWDNEDEVAVAASSLLKTRHVWKKIAVQVTRNPVLWAILVGFTLTLSTVGPRFLNPTSGDYVPGLGWIFLTLDWLGACVSPVSLFAMGVWMQKEWRSLFGIPWWSATLYMLSKLVIVPMVMVFLAKAMHLDNQSGRAAVLIAALPISLASFVLASRYKIGEAVLSENVALGTILILPTILIWNIVLDQLDVFPLSE